ncbi:MAG: type II toxin-antitoxin system VapC family toxin [Candidatus Acidiferrum sp.]
MRTAIDTNVLSALWSKEPFASDIARNLGNAKAEGGLVVSGPVYAELLAYPKATESFVNDFLAHTGITVEFAMEQAAWVEAGRRFARYAKRRRRSAAQGAKRLLADFLIGAHALAYADRFMTLDPRRYARDFPELRLV